MIRGRVKDGLREQVDLYLAQASLLAAKEEVKNISTNLSANLETLSNALHRSVKINEVDILSLSKEGIIKLPTGNIEKNKVYQSLEKSALVVMSGLQKAENSLLPTLQLVTSYSTNEYATKGSTVINDGNLSSDNSAYSVGINLAWSIGSAPQELEKAKYRIKYNDAINKKKKILTNFKNAELTLLNKVKDIEANIKSVDKRRNLSIKAYNEYNRLYNRGRTDLDQLIRSEENLINTEKSYASYLARQKTYIYALSRLYGSLEKQIISNRE